MEVKLKIKEIKRILLELSRVENPPSILLLGEPGIGKSQVIKEVGKEVGRQVIDIRLAQIEPADLGGIPRIKKNTWEYLQNEILIRATVNPTFLFFDEFNQANPSVLSAMFRIILDRCLSDGTGLHPKTVVVAAGNDNVEDNFISEMPFALQNRFFLFKILFDENEFLEYAKNNLSAPIYNFLNENRKFIYSRELNLTPRRWEQIDKLLKSGMDIDTLLMMLPYQVRKGLASYLKENNINVEEIIKNPERILTLSPSEIEDILIKIVQYFKQTPQPQNDKLKNIMSKIPKALRVKVFNTMFPAEHTFSPEEGKMWIDILLEEEEEVK